MSSTLAGELAIDLVIRDGVVDAVEIVSTRPQLAGRVLTGRPADAAVALVPQLFSVCGRAQSVAAELALAAARGAMPTDAQRAAFTRRVEGEIAQEYLWRALLDWPQMLGDADIDTAQLALLRRALQSDPTGAQPATRDALREAVERAALSGDAAAWYEREHVPAFEIWIAQSATPAARLLAAVQREGARHGAPRLRRGEPEVALLPALVDSRLVHQLAQALLDDDGFTRAPRFNGQPAETGAIGRLAAHPLVAALQAAFGRSTLTRLAARLTELARIAAGLPAPQPMLGCISDLGARRGIGWVETARGLLMHMIELGADGQTVARYRILAPTEWNFHPQGALASGLLGAHVSGERELRQRAEWLVQALDPCVGYALHVRDARAGAVHA